jgi:hypothetical protein
VPEPETPKYPTVNFAERREQARCLRTLPLDSVLRLWGAQPDHDDKNKWHTQDEVLSVNGAKFMSWSRAVGGGGAIDLVMHLENIGFREAVDWLEHHFPGVTAPEPVPPRPESSLDLPPPDPSKLGSVKHYLAAQRGIAPQLIDTIIQAGTLYADRRANAVFVLMGTRNTPVGAELRGTTERSWRGMAPGSRKDLGFFALPVQPCPQPTAMSSALILCESAIDAISCFELHPGAFCVSTAGARPNPAWLKDLLDQHPQAYCGFDADDTGDEMARAMAILHPNVRRLRPGQHDWNDVLKLRQAP